ncbi:hypothetical protein ACVWXO_009295 [Bradyrhizobium sp. LM2.7]
MKAAGCIFSPARVGFNGVPRSRDDGSQNRRRRWTIEPYRRRSGVIGKPPTQTISRPSTTSIARTRCSIIRNLASASTAKIQESRFVQPNKKRFTVRRIVGGGDLWITELVLSYDGVPSYVVSIMEFRDGLVAHETQYFGDRFDLGPSRVHLVERVG